MECVEIIIFVEPTYESTLKVWTEIPASCGPQTCTVLHNAMDTTLQCCDSTAAVCTYNKTKLGGFFGQEGGDGRSSCRFRELWMKFVMNLSRNDPR